MSFVRNVMAVAALVTSVDAAAQAPVTASGGWVMATPAGATSTSAYAIVENPSMYEVYVVSVTSDVSASAEVADGPADTAKVVKELAVPAYGRAELKPGGTHIRLKDLKKPLKAGDAVELTLTTDGGTIIKVTAPVKPS